MSDWTSGYVADVGYTYGYYGEFNPLWVELALLNAGLVFPEGGVACELGFGQGVSVNVHAAASNTRWYGTDFNPSHAAFARELAEISGNGAELFDEAFEEFAQREDLPEFDFIGLHGIWSWVSDHNRHVMVDFVRRKLKVGGVLYISYNVMPGWAPMFPVRHLMTQHAAAMSAPGAGIINKVEGAIGFMEKLIGLNPSYTKAQPAIVERVKQIRDQNKQYVAHEYFNGDWQPQHFAEIANKLETAKLTYACSANHINHIDVINLTDEQQAFLKDIPDPVFRETVRDFITNQQFRRDYWVRGPRSLNPLEQIEKIRQQRVVLVRPRADVTLKAVGQLGEATFADHIYNPILDMLADHQAKSLGDIQDALGGQGITLAQIWQAVLVLTGKGDIASAIKQEPDAQVRAKCQKLNAHLMSKARSSNDIGYVASPITGGALGFGRFQLLFLLARSNGLADAKDWAKFAWQILDQQNLKIVKEGQSLQTADANLQELTSQAEEFERKWLPIIQGLGI